MPNHSKDINAIEDASFVASINDLTTPLKTIKENLLKFGVFPGCYEDCFFYAVQINGCKWLKKGVQHLMDNHEILFERIPSVKSLTQSVPFRL